MSSDGVVSVEECAIILTKLRARARELKPDGRIEPALTAQDFQDGLEELSQQFGGSSNKKFAAIETACRNVFNSLLASIPIEQPEFVEVWNLFDILCNLSDTGLCEPSLLFWLVEELLDSQTIDGCRIVFDYLDSRRERITAKNFKAKSLVILRACNELLRRLSRAEDTVFCGRVFIFMFQSFPLGDRSSVNLRGEYHAENVTAFEQLPQKPESEMEISIDTDASGEKGNLLEAGHSGTPLPATEQPRMKVDQLIPLPDTIKPEQKDQKVQEAEMDMDSLYPIFWSLQESFSNPTRLFDDNNLQAFKSGLEATVRKFKEVHQELESRGASRLSENSNRGVKRKRNSQEDGLSGSFNPKYLTSRDLFELEIRDLAFRRHVLVQALILVEFLLSLTPKSKRKLAHTSNKSVLYNYTLNDENVKWANSTRNDIALYLQQGPEGKFYYRMVDTVLSRDKNWVHWKADNCPPIQRDAVSAEEFAESEKGAAKACASKKFRATPLGSLDLGFLSDNGDLKGLGKLEDPERYSIPTVDSFRRQIDNDQFDIEMSSGQEKQLAIDARASKLWRTLRIAAKTKLSLFDKIDDGNNLKALFEPEADDSKEQAEINGSDGNHDPLIRDQKSSSIDIQAVKETAVT